MPEIVPILQVLNVCGPEMESCVGNQTLKDKSCLIPCTGLYADVADDAFMHTVYLLDQNMMRGKILFCAFSFDPYESGFQELSNGVQYWTSGSKERLQQMFSNSAEEKEDGVKSFTESYHKYKREYVKHLSFNPEEENLSKCVSD